MINSTSMPADRQHIVDEPPPFLRSWRNVYIAVLVYLSLIIFSFYVFTRSFA